MSTDHEQTKTKKRTNERTNDDEMNERTNEWNGVHDDLEGYSSDWLMNLCYACMFIFEQLSTYLVSHVLALCRTVKMTVRSFLIKENDFLI